MSLLTRYPSRLPILDDASPRPSPELLGDAAAAEAVASPTVMTVEDEASYLEAQLEAVQAVMARSEREAAATGASHAEAQAQLLGEFLVRFLVYPSGDV